MPCSETPCDPIEYAQTLCTQAQYGRPGGPAKSAKGSQGKLRAARSLTHSVRLRINRHLQFRRRVKGNQAVATGLN